MTDISIDQVKYIIEFNKQLIKLFKYIWNKILHTEKHTKFLKEEIILKHVYNDE